MRLDGIGIDGRPLSLTWTLTALAGDGPYIPTIPSVVLARKLARGGLSMSGAMPCMGLMSLADFTGVVSNLTIDQEVERSTPQLETVQPHAKARS